MAYTERQMAVKWQIRIVTPQMVVVVVELGSEMDQQAWGISWGFAADAWVTVSNVLIRVQEAAVSLTVVIKRFFAMLRARPMRFGWTASISKWRGFASARPAHQKVDVAQVGFSECGWMSATLATILAGSDVPW
jgi:hypothetical protein